MQNIRTRLSLGAIAAVAVLTPLLLTLLAIWHWKPGAFVLAFLLLLGGARVVYKLFTRKKLVNRHYRLAVGVAFAAVLLLIWMNVAVGGILGDNPANMMYLGVLLVGLTGVMIARLEAWGMSNALLTTAFSIVLVPAIALALGTPAFANGVAAVFGLHTLFAMLFITSASLFRRSAHLQINRLS